MSSIDYLFKANAKAIILLSHLGDPKGKVVPELSLKSVAPVIEKLSKRKVIFVP